MSETRMNVLWLSSENELIRELKGFARALERAGAHLHFLDAQTPPAIDVRKLLERIPGQPALIVHPEPFTPALPRGLAEIPIPTVGFQCDVYAYTHRRLFYSMLFDYAAILHPGFEDAFRRAGHPSTITLPFGIDPQDFFDSGEERVFEVASVGRLHPHLYKTRLEVLTALSREFKMNQWDRFVEFDGVAAVYRASKIAVNIPRDDYPIDVSLRFAEAMACGALFLTRTPTEMTALGFEEGVHYIGYRDPAEVPRIVRKYLADEASRARIAQAGREKVTREHTYDARIAKLLERIRAGGGKLRAPARSWPRSRVRLAYLDYFAGNGVFEAATEELWAILKSGSPESWKALRLIGRSRASRMLNYIKFRKTSFWPTVSKG